MTDRAFGGALSQGWGPGARRAAIEDLTRALALWPLWTALGWDELRQRYRRSALGPFWITISMTIFIAAIGTLYGKMIGAPAAEYLPHLATGYVIWHLVQGALTDGTTLFVQHQRYLKQMRLPCSLFALMSVWRGLLLLAHNALVVVGVLIIFQIAPTVWFPLAFLGLIAVALNALWMTLLLALIGARFRDLQQIMQSLVSILFFLSPVLFHRNLLGRYSYLADFNPVTHLIEVIRQPLLGHPPPLLSWIVLAGMLAVGGALTFLLFQRFRARVAYWL